MNFDKSITGLHYLRIFSILIKFKDDQRWIVMSSYLNSSFCNKKEYIEDEFMDWIINCIQLAWKLTCVLRTYRTFNLMIGF